MASKRDRCAIANLLESLDGPNAINQLQGAFGHLIPQARLAREKQGQNSRTRFFTAAVTFWAFLAQVLATRGPSCRDALRRIQTWRLFLVSQGCSALRRHKRLLRGAASA